MQNQDLLNAIKHLTNEIKESRGDLKSTNQTTQTINVNEDLLSTLKSINNKFNAYSCFLFTTQKDFNYLLTADLCLEDLRDNLECRLNDFNVITELEYNLSSEFHKLVTKLESD